MDCGIVGSSQRTTKNNEVYSAKHTHTARAQKTFPSPHMHFTDAIYSYNRCFYLKAFYLELLTPRSEHHEPNDMRLKAENVLKGGFRKKNLIL